MGWAAKAASAATRGWAAAAGPPNYCCAGTPSANTRWKRPETNFRHWTLSDLAALPDILRLSGFPAHGLIVGRPGETAFHKALTGEAALRAHLARHLADGPLHLECDMRAPRNPTRMAMIARCAAALAERLASACPDCGAPGFGEIAPLPGAP